MIHQTLQKHWLLLSGFLLLLITLASLMPVPAGPAGNDKVMHFISYGLLMLPAAYAAKRSLVPVALFYLSWSGAIELVQPYVNRYAEWLDLLMNGIGLLIGLFVGLMLRKLTSTIELNSAK